MSKYIDAEKLITKIKARQLELVEHIKTDTPSEKAIDGSKTVELQWILDNIDSLQQEQPEVDLDEEINRFWDSCIKHKNEKGGNVIWSNKLEIEALVRHFYDRGLNARK